MQRGQRKRTHNGEPEENIVVYVFKAAKAVHSFLEINNPRTGFLA